MSDEATSALVREIRGALQGSINSVSARIRAIITRPYEDEIARLKAELEKPRNDESRKAIYEKSLAIFVEHSRKLGRKCEESRNAGRGSFGWMDNDPDAKAEWDANHALQHYLAREYLVLEGREKDTVHGKSCIDCGALRYGMDGTENGRWYCQEECEDK